MALSTARTPLSIQQGLCSGHRHLWKRCIALQWLVALGGRALPGRQFRGVYLSARTGLSSRHLGLSGSLSVSSSFGRAAKHAGAQGGRGQVLLGRQLQCDAQVPRGLQLGAVAKCSRKCKGELLSSACLRHAAVRIGAVSHAVAHALARRHVKQYCLTLACALSL